MGGSRGKAALSPFEKSLQNFHEQKYNWELPWSRHVQLKLLGLNLQKFPGSNPTFVRLKTEYIYIHWKHNLHWSVHTEPKGDSDYGLWSPAAHQPRGWDSFSSPSSTSSPVAVVSTDSPHQLHSSKRKPLSPKGFPKCPDW